MLITMLQKKVFDKHKTTDKVYLTKLKSKFWKILIKHFINLNLKVGFDVNFF